MKKKPRPVPVLDMEFETPVSMMGIVREVMNKTEEIPTFREFEKFMTLPVGYR